MCYNNIDRWPNEEIEKQDFDLDGELGGIREG